MLKLPIKAIFVVDDTIGQLGGVDTTPLKKSKPGENRLMVYMPEKRSFSFVKMAGKRKVDPKDLKKFYKTVG